MSGYIAGEAGVITALPWRAGSALGAPFRCSHAAAAMQNHAYIESYIICDIQDRYAGVH